MAESPASVQDLIDRSLRSLSDVELRWGSTKLEDAYTQIVTLRPNVDKRLDDLAASDQFRRVVVQVQCAMVLRVLNNPDGRLEEQGDDYSYRLDQAVSTGALYVTDAELQLLSAFDSTSDTAFSLRPTPIPVSAPDPWWLLGTAWY